MCGLGPGLSGAVFFVWKLCDNLFWGAKCKKKMFFFFCLTLCFSWKNRESQQRSWGCARVFWRIEKKKKEGEKWRFSLLVHYSQSLPESCRMRILRLVSKSQRSIFGLKCRQKFNLSPGTSSFFTFKFLPCVPARASSYLSYMYTKTLAHAHVYLPSVSSSSSLSSSSCVIVFVIFLQLWCASLSLYLCIVYYNSAH